jgi:hypothetical protein
LKGKAPASRKRVSQAVVEVQKQIIQEIIKVEDEVQVSRGLIPNVRFG